MASARLGAGRSQRYPLGGAYGASHDGKVATFVRVQFVTHAYSTFQYTTQMNIEPDMKVSYKFQEEIEDLIYKHHVNLMMVRLTECAWHFE